MQLNTASKQIENVGDFLNHRVDELRTHPRSLVSTFFGDLVMPNDGYTWVETIVSALNLLGVNDRLVRTTLFRMREDGWLESTRCGRKSYYQLTEHALRRTRFAEKLFYYQDRPDWDGAWTLVFFVTSRMDLEERNALVEELQLIGFGLVTKGVWAHPSAKTEVIGRRINRLGLAGKVVCMRCENIYDAGLGLNIDDEELATLSMPAAEVESAYTNFLSTFSMLLDDNGELQLEGTPAQLLSLRLLLIDEFRRAVLRDHHLPAELLPEDWSGYLAYRLCGKIYKQIFRASNQHYNQLQSNAGDVPVTSFEMPEEFRPGADDYLGRFGDV